MYSFISASRNKRDLHYAGDFLAIGSDRSYILIIPYIDCVKTRKWAQTNRQPTMG